jgi:DNA modification methylase
MCLVAGERRYLAHRLLGRDKIWAVIRPTLGKIDALEIELVENTARKDLEWPERVRLERRIWDLKSEADSSWSLRKQADLTGQHHSTVDRRIKLAEWIELEPSIGECKTEDEAWKQSRDMEERLAIRAAKRLVSPEVVEASKWASDHYLVGDALAGMATIADRVADFAEVDPPYGVELDRRKIRNTAAHLMNDYTEVPANEYEPMLRKVAEHVFRILKDDSFAVFWFGPTHHQITLATLRQVGFKVPDIAAVWCKNGSGQTAQPDMTFGSSYEPFWLARKGEPKLAMTKRGRSNVFQYDMVPSTQKIHLTEKPLPLMKELVEACCLISGSKILVPFLGSGVTLRAAYELGHTGFGWDLSEHMRDKFLAKVRQSPGVGNPTITLTSNRDEPPVGDERSAGGA